MQVNFNASLQRDDYPKFALADYKEFPIPNISLIKQKPLIDLVKRRLKNEYVDDKIDALVYELYDLTDKEIKIVNGE
jgi:type II restriction/modification system DNA methylase subunit YeeA